MRGALLSTVSETFMLSVEIVFEPLEPLEDAIVIMISCEGGSILDFRLVEIQRLLDCEKNPVFYNLLFTKLQRLT